MTDQSLFPFDHSPHDYQKLVQEWQQLSQHCGLTLVPLDETDHLTSYVLSNQQDHPSTYISAGVHGDECASVWALLEWAKANPQWLRDNPVTLFPCLNPSGLIDNLRADEAGRDLNRCFHDASIPKIAAWQRFIASKRFTRSLCLHEDFDARGIYLYEVSTTTGLGREILDRTQSIIPLDPRPDIEGTHFDRALTSHSGYEITTVVAEQLAGGYPEPIYLYLNHCDTNLTFETPSELSLTTRIRAHTEAINTFVNS